MCVFQQRMLLRIKKSQTTITRLTEKVRRRLLTTGTNYIFYFTEKACFIKKSTRVYMTYCYEEGGDLFFFGVLRAGCVVCRNCEVDESSDSRLNPELLAVFILE